MHAIEIINNIVDVAPPAEAVEMLACMGFTVEQVTIKRAIDFNRITSGRNSSNSF